MNILNKKNIIAVIFVFLFVFVSIPIVFAQLGGVPTTYVIFDITGNSVQDGDIITFNEELNLYEQSHKIEDENVFGVVELEPVIVFRKGTNEFPIIQSGEVRVNVSTINGPIEIGDSITTSEVPGRGQKFSNDSGLIIGRAISEFNETSTSSIQAVFNGKEIFVGSALLELEIGPARSDLTKPVTPATIFIRAGGEEETGLETIFRYITAVLFTIGTLLIVLKTFGPNLGKGIVSIGRNPLAKTSIQAMVVFNIVLIVSITAISFIVALLIIFLPL